MISQKRILQQRDLKFPIFVPRKFIFLSQHFLAYTWEEEINSILMLDNSNNCSPPPSLPGFGILGKLLT